MTMGDRPGRLNTAIAKIVAIGLSLCVVSGLDPSAPAEAADLTLIYQASFSVGSLDPSLDVLGFGALQPGYSSLNHNPTFTPVGDSMLIGITRPVDPIVGPAGAGLFATPVSFDQGSVFALYGTFVAPVGPHG